MTTPVCDKSEEYCAVIESLRNSGWVVKQPDAELTNDELANCDIDRLCQALQDRFGEIPDRPDFAEAILDADELTSLAEKYYEPKPDYTELDQLREISTIAAEIAYTNVLLQTGLITELREKLKRIGVLSKYHIELINEIGE